MPIKPYAGYATTTDAVLALRAEGKTTQEIAEALDIKPNAVTGLESSALRKVSRSVTREDPGGRAMLLPSDILSALYKQAARRGITPNHLARLIVETVIDADLVDAVLDDAEGLPDAGEPA